MSAPEHRPSVVILLSGAGTTMAPLLAAAAGETFGASVAAVGSDRPSAPGLELAAAQGVATFVVDASQYPNRVTWSSALADTVAGYQPDLVLCAGLMRILDPLFLNRFPGRVVNSHPSLLPAFPGAVAVSDALAYGVQVTGATLHLVDAGVDTGPIIAQVPVPVLVDDDESSLHERIKTAERQMLLDLIPRLAAGELTIDGRRVTLQ